MLSSSASTHNNNNNTGSPNTEHFPPGFKPLPDPIRNGHGHGGAPSSDLSSVAPSQSASQIAVPLSPPTHSQHINRDVPHLHLDPPHAISDYALFPSHTLARRITEEDFNAQDDEGGGSSEEEEEGEAGRHVEAFDNPRYRNNAKNDSPASSQKKEKDVPRSAFALRQQTQHTQTQSDIGPSTSYSPTSPTFPNRGSPTNAKGQPTNPRGRKDSSSGFFGSLRGLFGKKDAANTILVDGETSGYQRAHGKKWETRTDRNVKHLARGGGGGGGDSDGERAGMGMGMMAVPVVMPAAPSSAINMGESPGKKRLRKTAQRSSSGPVPTTAAKKHQSLPPPPLLTSTKLPLEGEEMDGREKAAEWLGSQHRSEEASLADPNAHVGTHRNASINEAGWTSDGTGTGAGTVKRRRSTKSNKSGTGVGAGAGKNARQSQDSSGVVTLVVDGATDHVVPISRNTSMSASITPSASVSRTGSASRGTGGANLSRNTSLRSTGSAPPPLTSASATASIKKGTTARRAMSEYGDDEHGDASSRHAKSVGGGGEGKRKTHGRSATVSHPSRAGEGKESLMSIVEGVARQNRDSWKPSGEDGLVLPSSRSAPVVGSAFPAKTNTGSKRAPTTTAIATRPSLLGELKAPASVIGDQRVVQGLPPPTYHHPTTTTTYRPKKSLEPLPVADPPVAGPSSKPMDGGTVRHEPGAVKMPLRSALRTPSPMPTTSGSAGSVSPVVRAVPEPQSSSHLHPSQISLPMSPPPTQPREIPLPMSPPPPPQAFSPPPQAASRSVSPPQAGPQTTDAGLLSSQPSPSASQLNGDVKGKGRAVESSPEQEDEDEDDTASIASYETVREDVYESPDEGDGDGTRTSQYYDAPNLTPTTSNANLPESTNSHADPDPATLIRAPTPQKPPALPMKDTLARLTSADVRRSGSDVSNSSGSTAIAAGRSDQPVVENGDHQNGSGGVRRRKSVRVSLQPTFSPTPPALDDDTDEERYAPWAGAAAAPSRPRANGAGQGVESSMWEDSSEEDEEYSRARKLLSRVTRHSGKKGRSNGHAS